MSKPKLKPLIIIGGGGHASVLVDILRMQGRNIVAIVSPDDPNRRTVFKGLTRFRNDDDVFQFSNEDVLLVNGIGVLPNSDFKQKLNQYYLAHGYQFETVIAETAQVSPYATVEAGAQVFAGAIIQAGARIASHVVINSGAIIEHDCCIGEYNHIAPNATLCGQVETEKNVFIGANATVIQGIKLAQHAVVGAGAVVIRNLLAGETCYPSRVTVKKSVDGLKNKGYS
ncbi:acetyltransferase [Vibrio tapetis]|uniref:acetyltransferase n=1 Tax=Vibrio tapetis TaxID=52443 RepID=UPI000C836773|nr:acetyltransferase [Vibrio tapetis]